MCVACDGVGGGGVLCCGVLLGGRGGRVGGWVLDGEGLVWVVGGGGESGLWKVGRVSIGDCEGEGGGERGWVSVLSLSQTKCIHVNEITVEPL